MKGRDAKPHVGIFGRRNNGKSSLINCLADQEVAIVSKEPGTTTDPVKKSMEITQIGPVVMIDTAGTDDTGEIGKKRVDKTREVIRQIDLGILVLAGNLFDQEEESVISQFEKWEVPYLVVHNKSDLDPLHDRFKKQVLEATGKQVLEFSALHPHNREALIGQIQSATPESATEGVVTAGQDAGVGLADGAAQGVRTAASSASAAIHRPPGEVVA